MVFLDVFLPDLFSSFISVTNMVPCSRKLTETYLCKLYTYKTTWSHMFNYSQLLDVYGQINRFRKPFFPFFVTFWKLQTGNSPLKLQFWRCSDPVTNPILNFKMLNCGLPVLWYKSFYFTCHNVGQDGCICSFYTKYSKLLHQISFIFKQNMIIAKNMTPNIIYYT